MDISGWLERHAGFTPEKTALRFEGAGWSYARLHERVRALARGLKRELRLRRGDRVAFLGHNHPDFLTLLFACARLGLIVVPLNFRLEAEEQAYILAHAGAESLFLGPGFHDRGERLAAGLERLVCVPLDAEAPAGPSFAELLLEAGDDRNPHVDLGAPLLIVYTSGTTGRPKGAVLRQEALFWNAVNAPHMFDLTSRDRVLTVLPLFHVGGLNIQTTPALHAGAEVVLLPRFDAGATLSAIEEEAPSLTVLVPATMRALVTHPRWAEARLDSLRMIACGSQTVPRDLLEAFHARGIPAAQVYGSTETAPIAIYQRAEDALAKPGSTGKPGLHVEVRVVDGAGRPCGPGERGEILVRGPNVMYEYWGDEVATRDAFEDGWFRTGDIGYRDAAGDFWIVERKKDVIVSGGENIYPAELERVLRTCPRIRDCVVVAGSDERWGEVPIAVVVRADPGLTAEEVLRLFEGRIARFKHPRAVVFVDELPRNALGKVLRYRVRDWVARGKGLL